MESSAISPRLKIDVMDLMVKCKSVEEECLSLPSRGMSIDAFFVDGVRY